jgi:hypothetical protein
MIVRVAALILLSALAARADHDDAHSPGPVLSRTNEELAEVQNASDLLVFKGRTLLNEFVYRTIVHLPEGAQATPATAKLVVQQIAAFLAESGYDLAKVRAQASKDGHIEISIDEGALDKIIVIGGGWITALRFRSALNLPLDVFNRRAFEAQFPRLAHQFGFKTYRYELWPVQLLGEDNASSLDEIEELRAMPLLHAARGYELRIFGKGEQWGSGFSPEIILNGAIGFGIGGRYRWANIFQDGDRMQAHFRVGAASRSTLDATGASTGSSWTNTEDYVSARWLSRSWDGTDRGLRMTIAPHYDLWELQRPDLLLQSFRIGTLELGAGAGSQLTREFSLFFTLGVQRVWLFDVNWVPGIPANPDVASVPKVSNRGFLRATSQYTFNPEELRVDHRDSVSLTVDGYQPTIAGTTGYFHLDFNAYKYLALGWHELRFTLQTAAEAGDVLFIDETPLVSQIRLGLGLQKWTRSMATVSLEFRYSLLRDKVKLGVFSDTAMWRHLERVDPSRQFELAGAAGGGVCLFLADEFLIDVFYGVGWTTDGYSSTGLALTIKEAF